MLQCLIKTRKSSQKVSQKKGKRKYILLHNKNTHSKTEYHKKIPYL